MVGIVKLLWKESPVLVPVSKFASYASTQELINIHYMQVISIIGFANNLSRHIN